MSPSDVRHHEYWQWAALVGIAMVAFALGVLEAAYPDSLQSDHTPQAFGVDLAFALFLFLWYFHDAALRQFARTRYWDLGIIFVTSVVVFPWHLIKTRGRKGALKTAGKIVAYIVLILIPAMTAGLAVGEDIAL
jgi:hypothetical protein